MQLLRRHDLVTILEVGGLGHGERASSCHSRLLPFDEVQPKRAIYSSDGFMLAQIIKPRKHWVAVPLGIGSLSSHEAAPCPSTVARPGSEHDAAHRRESDATEHLSASGTGHVLFQILRNKQCGAIFKFLHNLGGFAPTDA